MRELNNTYYVCGNLSEYHKVFLVLSTYFKIKSIDINSFNTYPIIFIENFNMHGARKENPLITNRPDLVKKDIKTLLISY